MVFQLYGHHRSPSMEEFKEVTQRDAEIRMAQELDKLRRTARTDAQAQSIDVQVHERPPHTKSALLCVLTLL